MTSPSPSPPTALLLHGYAAAPHEFDDTLLPALSGAARLVAPLGPTPVTRARLEALTGRTDLPALRPDLRCWVDHYDDGYPGLDASLAMLSDLFAAHRPAGVIGYSNGGLMAYLLAAARQSGDARFASLRWIVAVSAVCDARAQRHVRRLLVTQGPIDGVSVLCFAGRRDPIVAGQGAFVGALLPGARQVFHGGGHALPDRPPAWAPVREFVTEQAGSYQLSP